MSQKIRNIINIANEPVINNVDKKLVIHTYSQRKKETKKEKYGLLLQLLLKLHFIMSQLGLIFV